MKLFKTISIFFLLGFTTIFGQTIVPAGDISGVWEKENSPFLIEGNILLPADKKLTIEAGVTIVFLGQFSIEIVGKVEAIGNEEEGVTFTIQDTTGFASGNFTGWGGIIFDGFNSNLIENSVLNHCVVEYASISGITCVGYDHLLITNCSLLNNQGSGISLYEDSNIELQNISISNNGNVGFMCNNSSPYIDNFEIIGNKGSGINCSGIGSNDNPANFTNGKILYNITGLNGGGVSLVNDAGAFFQNVEISGNEALNGGGLYCDMSGAQFQNVTISDNIAENGGGIYSGYYVVLSLNRTLISGNHAISNGGGLYIMESNTEILNATISDNFAGENGGGIYHLVYSALSNEIRNSILWNNFPDEILSVYEYPVVSFSNIMEGFEGAGNIDNDPLFVNPFSNDYQLQWMNFPEENGIKSPCIDMGDPISTYDPDGTIKDMGAFFFNQEYITIVKENIIESVINIYPNPVKNQLNINDVDGYVSLAVFSLTGETIIEKEIDNRLMDMDVSSLKPGMYIVVLQSLDSNLVTKKFIKQ